MTCRAEEESKDRHDPHIAVGGGKGEVQHYERNASVLYSRLKGYRDYLNRRVQQILDVALFMFWSIFIVLGSICAFQKFLSTQPITESFGLFYHINMLYQTYG